MRSTIDRFAVGLPRCFDGSFTSLSRSVAGFKLGPNCRSILAASTLRSPRPLRFKVFTVGDGTNRWDARTRRHTSMRPTILAELIVLEDARSNFALRLGSLHFGQRCQAVVARYPLQTPTNHDMDTERRIGRLQVDATLASPGHVRRSGWQDVARSNFCGRYSLGRRRADRTIRFGIIDSRND